MMNWYDNADMRMSRSLAEDVLVPELRSPRQSGMTAKAGGWLARLLRRA